MITICDISGTKAVRHLIQLLPLSYAQFMTNLVEQLDQFDPVLLPTTSTIYLLTNTE
jgi:hypothetical protein